MACRICLEDTGELITPCNCKGTSAYVHDACLTKWLELSERDTCEICHEKLVKTEKCSCEPKKYFLGCFSCSVQSQDMDHIQGMSIYIISMSAIGMILAPVEHYVLLDAIVSISIFIVSLHYCCWYKKHIHNVMLVWKFAFSAPYLIACLVNYIYVSGDCEEACLRQGNFCDNRCPVFPKYARMEHEIDISVYMELINLGILLVARSFLMCFVHMRKLSLADRPDSNATPSSSFSSDGSLDARPLLTSSDSDDDNLDASV